MKAVVRILRPPASAAALLRYCYRQRAKDDDASRAEVAGVSGRAEAGVFLRDARVDAEVFESRCRQGARAVAHVVISAERDGEGVNERLMKSSHEWCARYAPERSYVVVIHRPDRDCSHPHAHLVVERYGEKGVALRFSRRDVRDMVAMRFTSEFQSVRPDGTRSPHKGASQVYPAARRLHARELALRLVSGETSWEKLLRDKEISPARLSKAGELASFIYREQRLRVATVEKLVQRERSIRAQRAAGVVAREAGRGMSSVFSLGDELANAVSEVEAVAQKPQGRSR